MPINNEQVLQVVTELKEVQGMRVTINESGKWAAITGAGVFVGGLLLGPVGIAAGGIVGGCIGAMNSRGKFIKHNLYCVLDTAL